MTQNLDEKDFFRIWSRKRCFHKLDEIDNISIRSFAMWNKNSQQQNVTFNEDWTGHICHPCLMLSFLG